MAKKEGRAQHLIFSKLILESGYIQEINIWGMTPSQRYPDGIRYRLVLANPDTGQVALLYDNHWPKGHHFHLGKTETPYHFASVEQLLEDFLRHVARIEREK